MKYRFRWRDGSVNEGEGATPEEAFARLGFGAGAVPALDCYEAIIDDQPQSPGGFWKMDPKGGA